MNKQQSNHPLPYVSVVMPAYNADRTLMESVESVLNQTYRDFELIICNDASTDETLNILNKITDDRVRIIHNYNNLGEGPTRDRAIDAARGVWLAVIDADDAWAPERLEVMLREAQTSADKMIFDDIIQCHDTPLGIVPWRVLRGKYAFGCNGTDAIDVPTETWVSARRLLIKPLLPLICVKQNNVHHGCSRFYADNEFFLRLLSLGLRLRYLPKAMYYYRITPGSMTGLKNRWILMRELLENAINYFEHEPNVQAALRKKISWSIRGKNYSSFIMAKKNRDLIEMIRIVYQYPWIIRIYLRKIIKGIFYHIHRIRHGGRTRGIR